MQVQRHAIRLAKEKARKNEWSRRKRSYNADSDKTSFDNPTAETHFASFWDGIKIGINKLKHQFADKLIHKNDLGPHEVQIVSDFIIYPDTNFYKIAWDILMAIFVYYTIIVVPYRIGFDADPSAGEDGFENFITACFAIDMFLNFNTAFYDSATDKWITDKREIAKNYFSCWFWIDIAATIPFDQIAGAFTSGGNLGAIRAIRFLRLLRLSKINQILRQTETFETLFNPFVFNSIILLSQIFIIAHVLACFWHYITLGDEINATYPNTWVQVYGFDTKSINEQYVASLYFIFVTMMTIGYGDICPVNELEKFYAILTMLIGTIVFGGLVAQVTVMVHSQDPYQQRINEQQKEFKEFLTTLSSLPQALKDKAIIAHAYYLTKKCFLGESDELDTLAKPFIQEIVYDVYSEDIEKISFFRRISDRSVVVNILKIARPFEASIDDILYHEGDILQDVIFLKRGVVAMNIHIKTLDDHMSSSGGQDNSTKLVGFITEGNMLGDLELSRNISTTVVQYRAVKHVHALSVGSAQLKSILSDNAVLSQQFEHYMTLRSYSFQRIAKAKRSLFPTIGDEEIMNPLVAASMTSKPASHQMMTHETHGDGDDELFLWINGEIVQDSVDIREKHGLHPNSSTVASTAKKENTEDEEEVVTYAIIEHGSPSTASSSTTTTGTHKEITMKEFTYTYKLLHPGNPHKVYWDIFIAILIFYSVLVAPVQLGFDTDAYDDQNATSYVIDVFFFFDILANFRTAIESSDHKAFIVDTHYIAKEYLQGWFVIDFLSTFPFDAITSGGSTNIVKVLRILRLFRLVRVLKFRVYLEKLEATTGISAAYVELVTLILQLFFMAHLVGCVWWGITSSMTTNPWYSYTGGNATTHSITGMAFGRLAGDGIHPAARYLMSIYFAITTMTTVGYGDVHPMHMEERIVAIFIIVFGASMFGYIIANVGAILTTSNSTGTSEKLSEIAGHLTELRTSPVTTERILSYFKKQLKNSSGMDVTRFTNRLPSMLGNPLLLAYHETVLQKISIFAYFPNSTLALYVFSLLKPFYCETDFYLCREEKHATDLMFLLSGRAKVFQRLPLKLPLPLRKPEEEAEEKPSSRKSFAQSFDQQFSSSHHQKRGVVNNNRGSLHNAIEMTLMQPSTSGDSISSMARQLQEQYLTGKLVVSATTKDEKTSKNNISATAFEEMSSYWHPIPEIQSLFTDLDSIFEVEESVDEVGGVGNDHRPSMGGNLNANFRNTKLNKGIDGCTIPMKDMTGEDFVEYGYDYLGEFTAGDFMGFLPFLYMTKTSSSSASSAAEAALKSDYDYDHGCHFNVRAIDNCSLFVLHKAQLMKLVSSEPTIGMALQTALTKAIVAQEECITKWKKQVLRHLFYDHLLEAHDAKKLSDATTMMTTTNRTIPSKESKKEDNTIPPLLPPATIALHTLFKKHGLIGEKKRDVWYSFEKESNNKAGINRQRKRSQSMTNQLDVLDVERRRWSVLKVQSRRMTHNKKRRRQSFPSMDDPFWPSVSMWSTTAS